MLPDLKRPTLRNVMLQGYNKSLITSEKTFSSFLGKRLSHDTGRLWIAVGVTFPLEKARRRHGTLLHYKATAILFAARHFRFYPPLPSQIFLACWQFLFFINTKIKKRFSFWISSALILFRAFSLHLNSFL